MNYKLIVLLLLLNFVEISHTYTQTISTFDSLSLMENSFWNGSEKPYGTIFTNGNAIFPNYYDTSFGGFWASGWAYSNKKDSATAGFSNIYSAITAAGFNASTTYAIGTQEAKIYFNSQAIGKLVNGFYVTNSTYAALSMKYGDNFAKKFGGSSGNDEDWFKLTIKKWNGGILSSDSIDFFLADFRFSDNSKDNIVKDWQWVDLTALGNVDSLQFHLSSNDVGIYGMNTPSFFCIDNFTTSDSFSDIIKEQIELTIDIFPNPVSDYLNIEFCENTSNPVKVVIRDFTGKIVSQHAYDNLNSIKVPVDQLKSGIYFLNIYSFKEIASKTFIKK